MRLIDVNSFKLQEFSGSDIPPYAILSHTWGDAEVSFQEWQDLQEASRKAGYSKIYGACQQAKADGLEWLWVDTNCIDKTSSAELSEAINSMFQWYAQSQICYAYLVDVPTGTTNNESDQDALMERFRESRWFTRGWTLQELLAPTSVVFYAYDWTSIGSRETSLCDEIYRATGIDRGYLINDGTMSPLSTDASTKMFWLSKREVTREEDLAYCMLGLFDINMSLLYGEGMKAFTRLQDEIVKSDNDHTIFCWEWIYSITPMNWSSFLAPSPLAFRNSHRFRRRDPNLDETGGLSTYQMTNAGLSIKLPMLYTGMAGYIVALDVENSEGAQAWIQVSGHDNGKTLYVSRQPFPPNPLMIRRGLFEPLRSSKRKPLVVRHKPRERPLPIPAWLKLDTSPSTDSAWAGRYGILPVFGSTKLQSAWARFHQLATDSHDRIMWLDMVNKGGAVNINDIYVPNILTNLDKNQEEVRISLYLGFVTAKMDQSLSGWICRLHVATDQASAAPSEESEIMKEDFMRDIKQNGDVAYDRMGGFVKGMLRVQFWGDELPYFNGARVRLLLITPHDDPKKAVTNFVENDCVTNGSEGSSQSSTGAVWSP
ncbi:Vegetative incompatibility protein HET-E-1 [Colletotrichum siamense]|nr:Vegetative incompatibility protein HET-E-1 [Colletotrichum siamense]